MILASFILENIEQILQSWEEFARSIPSAKHLDVAELRDHAASVLKTIAEEMLATQSDAQQEAKSKGLASPLPNASAAERHGGQRAAQGLDINEMFLEFRALRASVIRLWEKSTPSLRPEALHELTRFNEGLDQALGESIKQFTESLDRTREMFLAVLGHDLRTPVGAIMLSAEYMKNAALRSPEETSAAADRILRSGFRVQKMVEDVLDMTRQRLEGKLPVSPVQLDVGLLCRQVVDESKANHPRRTLRFEGSNDLSAELDEGRIARLLSNLVENAIRHGAVDAPVTVSAMSQKQWIVLAVHNTGPVIPRSALLLIFEPLSRRPARSGEEPPYTGLGLGLYIVRAIAQAHGGDVDVSSSREIGTTFTVRLPRKQPSVGQV